MGLSAPIPWVAVPIKLVSLNDLLPFTGHDRVVPGGDVVLLTLAHPLSELKRLLGILNRPGALPKIGIRGCQSPVSLGEVGIECQRLLIVRNPRYITLRPRGPFAHAVGLERFQRC